MRVIHDPDIRKMPVIRMNAEFKTIRPAARSRQILALTGKLEAIAVAKKLPPAKPAVSSTFNPTFSHRAHAKISS